MHEALHIAVLVGTLAGGAALVVLAAWPLLAEGPLPSGTVRLLVSVVVVAALLLLVEWRVVH